MLISCAVTAQLICSFVFPYANCWFSHVVAHVIFEKCWMVNAARIYVTLHEHFPHLSERAVYILQVKETPESEPDPQAQQPSSTPTPSADEKPTGSSCKCPPQTACKCEQAALPLTRQYVKSLLDHLHGQVSI